MGRRATTFGIVTAGLLVIACNALTGAGDLVEAPADGGLADVTSPPDAPVNVDAPPPKVEAGPALPCPAAGRSCAPAPPSGWEGPFLVFRGPRDVNVPACPGEMPDVVDANVGTPEGGIDCSQCRCGSPKNMTCAVNLFEYAAADCPFGDSVRNRPITPSTCITPTALEPYVSARPVGTVAQAGTCDAFVAPTGKTKGLVTWPEVLRLCGRDSSFLADGCSAGELCVPDGAAPFKTHTCIRNEIGDAACPAGWPEKLETFDEVDDTRDCSPNGCSCATPKDIDCTATTRNFTTSDCSGASTAVPIGGCINVTTESHRLQGNTLAASGGSCVASGTPTATGGVVGKPDARDVVCCLP